MNGEEKGQGNGTPLAEAVAGASVAAAGGVEAGALAAAVCRQLGAEKQWDEQKVRMTALLRPKRLQHSLQVADEAIRMGRRFGGDPVRLALAGLLHDGAKEMTAATLLATAEAQGLISDPTERINPGILHGPVAAWLAWQEWGIQDEVILQAIRLHTTGGPAMSREACIVFMADLVEPRRQYPGVAVLRQLCAIDLRQAMLEAIEQTFIYLEREGRPVHQGMARCLVWLHTVKGV